MAFLLAASDVQTYVGAVGAVVTAGGGVAWVIRIEKDLLGSYRTRLAELEKDLNQARKEREAWRERFWMLARKAMQPAPVQGEELDAILREPLPESEAPTSNPQPDTP